MKQHKNEVVQKIRELANSLTADLSAELKKLIVMEVGQLIRQGEFLDKLQRP